MTCYLSLVESLAIVSFVSILDSRYQLPSRKNISTKLLAEKAKELVDLLKQVQYYTQFQPWNLWSNC